MVDRRSWPPGPEPLRQILASRCLEFLRGSCHGQAEDPVVDRCHPWSFGTRRRGRFFAAAAATARADRLGARQRLVPARRRRLGRVLRSRQVAARRRAALRPRRPEGNLVGRRRHRLSDQQLVSHRRDGGLAQRRQVLRRQLGSNYVNGYSIDNGKIESSTLLLNGYIDFGRWYGFTPYVGAGVGVAQNHFHSYAGQVTCLTLACGPIGPQLPTPIPSHTTYNLAWAVMAGVAFDLGYGFKLDAGYRFVHVGDARAGVDAFGPRPRRSTRRRS